MKHFFVTVQDDGPTGITLRSLLVRDESFADVCVKYPTSIILFCQELSEGEYNKIQAHIQATSQKSPKV